jgi:energy-coupling factor transport system permease protein
MFMRVLDYFSFEKEKSAIHKLDPRGKALFVITVTTLGLTFREISLLLIIYLLLLPLPIIGGFFKKYLRSLLAILPLILIIFILNALLLQAAYPTTLAIMVVLRLLILTTVFGLFFQTVSPDDFAQMFIKLKLSYSLAWAISTAYRFVPTLAYETKIIIDAQKARGLDIDRGRLLKRVRKMLPLLIPIFASAFRRSWQLAEAIESRGWNATKKRTYFYSLKLQWYDYLLMLASLGVLGLTIYFMVVPPTIPFWLHWIIPERYGIKRLFTIIWLWIKGLFT